MLLSLYDHVFFRKESVIYSFQLQSLVSSLRDCLSLSKLFPLHLFICVHLIFFILKIWYFFTDNEEEIKQLREEVGELRRELKDLRGKLQTDFNSITIIRIRDSSSFPSPVQASPAKINITLVYIKLDSITYRCFR